MCKSVKIAVVVAMLLLSACTDNKTAETVLSQSGYKNIEITGYQPLGCNNYESSTGFVADTTADEHVSGVVCSSSDKKPTIQRF